MQCRENLRASFFFIQLLLMTTCVLWLSIDRAYASELIILGDNQSHQSRGSALLARSGFSDKYITEVTRRPPGQAIYGDSIFRFVIAQNDELPILHLGDGLDISCTTEAKAFFNEIENIELFVMAPGNHDGYFLGNFHPASEGPIKGKMTKTSWRLACQDRSYYGDTTDDVKESIGSGIDWDGRKDVSSEIPEAGRPFDRNDFIRKYIEHHGYPDRALSGDFLAHNGRLSITWSIVEDKPWESYVVQAFSFDSNGLSAAVLVMDTAQVWKRPKLGAFSPAAGVTGWISERQIDAAMKLASSIPSDRHFILAGHHDFKSLKRDARKRLALLAKRIDSKIYLSGHSHKGWTKQISIEGASITELNVGSLLDAPIEYRLASLTDDDDEPKLLLMQEQVKADWSRDSDNTRLVMCDPLWKLPVENAASPESYAPTGRLGWFKAAHRELDAHLAQLVHHWKVDPPKEVTEVCYVKDNEPLQNAFCSRDINEIVAHVEAIIGQSKNEITSRQKARLFAALHRARNNDSERVRRYQLCQAIDSSWRDYFRINRRRLATPSLKVKVPL